MYEGSQNGTTFWNTSKFPPQIAPLNCTPIDSYTWDDAATQRVVLAALVIAANLLNIFVFRQWRQSEPYVMLHQALAIENVLFGVSYGFHHISYHLPISRQDVKIQLVKIALCCIPVCQCLTVIRTLFISIDRWLSVEFYIPYRNHITRKKVYWMIGLGWVMTLSFMLPFELMTYGKIYRTCGGIWTLSPAGEMGRIYRWLRGSIYVPFLLAFQLRIAMIAVVSRLKLLRQKDRVNPHVTGQDDHRRLRTARVVWYSLMASMVIVLTTGFANMPAVITEMTPASMMGANRPITSVTKGITFEAHFLMLEMYASPLIYLTFFPMYRKVLCGRKSRIVASHTSGGVPCRSVNYRDSQLNTRSINSAAL